MMWKLNWKPHLKKSVSWNRNSKEKKKKPKKWKIR